MYKTANETISQGLSRGARILLGTVSGLFGMMMILSAPPNDKAVLFYLFGALCLLITMACFTRGRLRQFVGSLVGVSIFIVGVAYLVSQLMAGSYWSDSRGETSAYNAILYLFAIGIPGVGYAWRVRFGFKRNL